MKKLKICVILAKVLLYFYIFHQYTPSICEVSAFNHERSSATQFATTFKLIPKKSQEPYKIYQSAVIFCKDLEDLKEFNGKVELSNRYPKKLKFLVVFEKSIHPKFPTPYILTTDSGKIIEFQYFLVNKAGSIELSTFEWFIEGKCNQPQLSLLNTLEKTTLEWENQLVIKDKFKNFNKCPLSLFIISTKDLESCFRGGELIGTYLDVFKALSQRGNFRMNFSYFGNQQNEGRYNLTGNVQVILSSKYYSSVNFDKIHIATTHCEIKAGFALRPSESYTIYEKLYLPFDKLTWIFLIITFISAFGIISALRFAPPWIQHLIFGEGVRMPAFNVVGTFFGIGQVQLPEASFPRIILMTFIIFCLIIRTAYQGVFFEMMTHDLKRTLPKTIDDLYEGNFTITTLSKTSARILIEMIEKSRRPKIDVDNATTYFEQIENGTLSRKIVMFTAIDRFAYVFLTLGFEGFLEETLYTTQVGFGFEKNNFMFYLVDDVVQGLITGGIIQHCEDYYRFMCGFEYEEPDYEPQVFALEDVSFGFIIWIISCAVPVIVFCYEFLWVRAKKLTISIVKHLIGLYFLLGRLQRGFGL